MVSVPTAILLDLEFHAGSVAKEIDHVLIDCHWRMLQNCRIYQSAQFFNTDHRLLSQL